MKLLHRYYARPVYNNTLYQHTTRFILHTRTHARIQMQKKNLQYILYKFKNTRIYRQNDEKKKPQYFKQNTRLYTI